MLIQVHSRALIDASLCALQFTLAACVLYVTSIGALSSSIYVALPITADARGQVAALLSRPEIRALERGPVQGSIVLRFEQPPAVWFVIRSLLAEGVVIISSDFAGCTAVASLPTTDRA